MWRSSLTLLALAITGLSVGALADQRYTVQSGDSLSKLAKRFYGDVSGWRLIYRANRDQVFDGGDLVDVGALLIIPEAPEDFKEGLSRSGDPRKPFGEDSRISMARPTTVLLDNGKAFIGTIVGASANSILIRRGVRTFRINMARIDEARVDSQNGGVVAGELLDWRNGIFDLRANNYRLTIKDGEIINTSLLGSDGGSQVETISTQDVGIAEAPIIRFQNGKQITGYVTKFDQRFVTVRRGTRGSNRIRLPDISEVQITTPDGSTVAGALVDWNDGIYRLQSGTNTIVAREDAVPADPAPMQFADIEDDADDVITEVEPLTEPADNETTVAQLDDDNPPSEIRVRSVPTKPTTNNVRSNVRDSEPVSVRTTRAPETTPRPSTVASTDEATTGTGVGGDFIPIRELVPEEGESITVAVTALPASENAGSLRFEIDLSRAPNKRMVIVYASVDGTAKSGLDYEKTSGVEVFEPGQQTTYVDIPLIDDSEAEAEETIHLF
ncbi:MAG: Calx-beta domain-containing protein, partial [Pseudomonadota bacterium]